MHIRMSLTFMPLFMPYCNELRPNCRRIVVFHRIVDEWVCTGRCHICTDTVYTLKLRRMLRQNHVFEEECIRKNYVV